MTYIRRLAYLCLRIRIRTGLRSRLDNSGQWGVDGVEGGRHTVNPVPRIENVKLADIAGLNGYNLAVRNEVVRSVVTPLRKREL